VNKAELTDALANQLDMPKTDAARAVEALFGTDGIIAGELKAGRKVQITGFGSFQSRKRAARTGRNPRTGEDIQIAAANMPTFRAGQGLKDALN
jgi:DNA-binding protein HU-beta